MHPSTRRARLVLLSAAVFATSLTRFARAADPAVYSDQAILGHWSESAVSADSAGKPFHGPFGNQTASLTLEHLPSHHWIKVSFDLYIVGSWDGSSPVWGPDLWTLSVRGAQRLISSTFCGWGYAGNDEQSYPDDYPQAIHPAWTGALARNVVDIKDSEPPKNGVYRVEVVFPHTADEVILDFTGAYDDPPSEQQVWGIGKLEALALADETLTNEDALADLWEQLASADSVAANKALWQFVGAGAKAASFINDKVGRMTDGAPISEADGLRLHRAHRIVRIIGGEGALALCFRMDQLSPEYAQKYLGR